MEPNGRVAEENGRSEDYPGALSPSPRSKKHNAKLASILEACKWRDIATLKTLATSEGGLVSDDVRRQACSCYHGNLLFETDLP